MKKYIQLLEGRELDFGTIIKEEENHYIAIFNNIERRVHKDSSCILNISDEKDTIPFEQAKKMLPKRKNIHIFRQFTVNRIFGMEVERDELLESLKRYIIQYSGETAMKMGHGIMYIDEDGAIFVQTKKI